MRAPPLPRWPWLIYYTGVQLLDTWGALDRLVEAGTCRAIGLSDASIVQLEAIRVSPRIKPAGFGLAVAIASG